MSNPYANEYEKKLQEEISFLRGRVTSLQERINIEIEKRREIEKLASGYFLTLKAQALQLVDKEIERFERKMG